MLYMYFSISSKLSSDEQTAVVDGADKQVVWTLKRLPGKTESIAEFRVLLYIFICSFFHSHLSNHLELPFTIE